MKTNKILAFLSFLLLPTFAFTQNWIQDTTFLPADGDLFFEVHGVAVDGEGKIWVQSFYATETIVANRDLGVDGIPDTLSTRAIYVYNADGTPTDFSPLKVIEYGDGTPADTLGQIWNGDEYEEYSGRGLEADMNGDIIVSAYNRLYKVDHTDGQGMAKFDVPDVCAITEASVDGANNVYIGSVCAADTPIWKLDSNLENPEQLVTLTGSFSRDFQVSEDGNTIWWAGYTNGFVLKYTRPNDFSGFSATPDTVLRGIRAESFDIHPITRNLWIGSGSLNDTPEPPYQPQTWYAFDTSTLGTDNEVPLDSIMWAAGEDISAGYDNARPRGLDFSADGITAYVGAWSAIETDVDVQKFVNTNETAVEITTIGDARFLQDSSLVISGITSTPNYGFNNGQWFLEDETGGINVFFGGAGDLEVDPGDEHILYGTISEFGGQVQISVDSAEVISTGNEVFVSQIEFSEFLNVESPFQGSYVQLQETATYLADISDWPVEGFNWSGSGTNVYFEVAGDTLTYRIDRNEAYYDGTEEPADGEPFVLSGVLSRFNDDPQLFGGFFESDILETDIQTYSIAEARQQSVGTLLRVKGVVTSSKGENTTIQDSVAGLHLFADSGDFYAAVQQGEIIPGDSLGVTGRINDTNGRTELTNISSFEILATNSGLPRPVNVLLDDIDEEHESMRVRVFNISTATTGSFQNETSYDLAQSGSLSDVAMFVGSSTHSELAGTPIPDEFNFTGTISQDSLKFGSPGYFLRPVYTTDIEEFETTALTLNEASFPSEEIIGLTETLEIPFDQDIETFNGLETAFDGAITISSNRGFDLAVTDYSLSDDLLTVHDFIPHAIDTFQVSISSVTLEDNSQGAFYLDGNKDGEFDASADNFNSGELYTTLIGDFNDDFDVDINDLARFRNGWRTDDLTFETAPITFNDNMDFPHAVFNPDDIFNIDDLITFIRFWNYYHETNTTQKSAVVAENRSNPSVQQPTDLLSRTNGSNLSSTLDYITYEKADHPKEYSSDQNANREIEYVFSLDHPDSVTALSIKIDYDETLLGFKGLKDHKLFNKQSKSAHVFLSHVDSLNGVITINAANFGPLFPIKDREIITLTFETKADQDSEFIISTDIFAKDRAVLRQVARKAVAVRAELPQKIALSQNYPNPFNPTTTIHYELAEQSKVNLTIYDILGRKIETLVNQNSIRPGYYKTNWDASNYASGMYIYVLNVEGTNGEHQMITKKMVLVK